MIPKFRCWFKPENTMREITTMEFTDGILDYICFDYEELGCGPESCVLMQSTGLFDKNGVEIFEGDVLIYFGDTRDIFVCDWSENEPALKAKHGVELFELFFWKDECEDWEVIGNIHENPELMEVMEWTN